MQFLSGLTLVFITLKLLNQIDWSWIWVLSPIVFPTMALLVLAFVVSMIEAFSETVNEFKRK